MEPDLLPYIETCPVARHVLALAPHPDDEVFGCGGTLVRMKRAGAQVTEVVLTSGDLAGDGNQREIESRHASAVLGLSEPVFWRLPDRGVQVGELLDRLVSLLVSERVDMVLAPSPWEIHPDHRAVCQLALEAVSIVSVDVRLGFYEVGVPLRPNCLCDITSLVDDKLRAMACFTSQMTLQDYGDQILGLNRFRSYSLGRGVSHAEAFWFPPPDQLRLLDMQLMKAWATPGGIGRSSARTQTDTQIPFVNVVVLCNAADEPQATVTQAERLLNSLSLQTYPRIRVVLVGAPGGIATRWLGLQAIAIAEADAWPLESGFLIVAQPGDWVLPDHIGRLVDALNRVPSARSARTEVGCHLQSDMRRTGICQEENGIGTVGVVWRLSDAAMLRDLCCKGEASMFGLHWLTALGPSVKLAGVTAWTASRTVPPRKTTIWSRLRAIWNS